MFSLFRIHPISFIVHGDVATRRGSLHPRGHFWYRSFQRLCSLWGYSELRSWHGIHGARFRPPCIVFLGHSSRDSIQVVSSVRPGCRLSLFTSGSATARGPTSSISTSAEHFPFFLHEFLHDPFTISRVFSRNLHKFCRSCQILSNVHLARSASTLRLLQPRAREPQTFRISHILTMIFYLCASFGRSSHATVCFSEEHSLGECFWEEPLWEELKRYVCSLALRPSAHRRGRHCDLTSDHGTDLVPLAFTTFSQRSYILLPSILPFVLKL